MLKRLVQVCAVQFSCSKDINANAKKAEGMVRNAAEKVATRYLLSTNPKVK